MADKNPTLSVTVLRKAAEMGLLADLGKREYVLTGKMSMTRPELEKLIRACGGRIGKSVTYRTAALVVGDEGATKGGALTNKMRDARRYGVEMISEERLVEMLSGELLKDKESK